MIQYIIAHDPAKKRDFAATIVMRLTPQLRPGIDALGVPDAQVVYYDIVLIDNVQGLTYPKMADRVADICRLAPLSKSSQLVMDGTGVGEAMFDLFRERDLDPIKVVYTGGGRVTPVYETEAKTFPLSSGGLKPLRRMVEVRVPKPELVDAGRRMVQDEDRVAVAPGIAHRDAFMRQLLAFKRFLDERGSQTFDTEDRIEHDDLTNAFLLASWYALSWKHDTIRDTTIRPDASGADWSPYDF